MDISTGLLGGLAAGGQGFLSGMRDAEDRKYKKMEFEAKYKTEAQDREKKQKEQGMQNTFKMRDDWLKNQTTKNTQTVREAYDKIRSAGHSAAGDMSLIYGLMRMQDPGSTVRESEFANAQHTAGIPEQILNLRNRLLTGQRLTPEQRAAFTNQAARIYGAQKDNQNRFDDEFRRLATQASLVPDEVVLKLFGDDEAPAVKVEAAKPQGLIPKAQAKSKPKDKLDSMSDAELEKLYKAKFGG